MQQAGYSKSNPLNIELKYNTSENHKKIAIAIAAMWKQIGVKTTLFNQEAKVHFADIKNKEYEIARYGWIGDYNDPATFTNLFLDNAYNFTNYVNPKVLELAKQANKELDLKKRAKILATLVQTSLEDYPTIPIYNYVSTRLVSPKVSGYESNILDVHPYRYMKLSK